jgi:hypothetical protein
VRWLETGDPAGAEFVQVILTELARIRGGRWQ